MDLIEEEIELTLKVSLDHIDRSILDIFHSNPSRSFKLCQVRTILEYKGINLHYAQLTKRVKIFVTLSLLCREKNSRVYSYKECTKNRR
ncbi:MAG: hypothetical protein ACYCSO_05105 [Cuniculiplasma sp.]